MCIREVGFYQAALGDCSHSNLGVRVRLRVRVRVSVCASVCVCACACACAREEAVTAAHTSGNMKAVNGAVKDAGSSSPTIHRS